LLPTLFRDWDESKGSIQELLHVESQLLKDFKERSPHLLPSQPVDDWDWLSVGQHYGLPTRLLDWSANPLMALYFAVRDANPSRSDAVFWTFEVDETHILDRGREEDRSPFTICNTRVFQPRSHSLRVTLQQGWHTAHRFFKKKSDGTYKITPLDGSSPHVDNLDKYAFSSHLFPKMLSGLAHFGVTQATVFPDLAALCDDLKAKHFPQRRLPSGDRADGITRQSQ